MPIARFAAAQADSGRQRKNKVPCQCQNRQRERSTYMELLYSTQVLLAAGVYSVNNKTFPTSPQSARHSLSPSSPKWPPAWLPKAQKSSKKASELAPEQTSCMSRPFDSSEATRSRMRIRRHFWLTESTSFPLPVPMIRMMPGKTQRGYVRVGR